MTWTETKPIHWLLAIVVAAVWGMLLYRVTAQITAADEGRPAPASSSIAPLDTFPERPAQPYRAGFRDPFQRTPVEASPQPAPTPAPAPPKTTTDPQPTLQPARGPLLRGYTLVGVVDRTAIVRKPGQAIQFLSAGTYVEGAEVTTVTPDHVVVRHGERADTLRLTTSQQMTIR